MNIFGFEPIGFAPFGMLAGGTDLSEPNPLDALLRDPLPQRAYIFYGQPFDPGVNARVQVKMGDGYASRAADTLPDGSPMAHALFRAGLITPYNAQNKVMSDGDIAEDPLPGQGDLVFEMATGRFRPYLDYEWDNAEALVLMGRREWPLSQFASIFSGVTGPLQRSDTMEAHLPLLDNSYKLRRGIQSQVYLGHGAAVRYNGTTSSGSGTLTCPAGSMSILFYLRPTTSVGTQANLVGWRGGAAAGNRLVDISRVAPNRVGFNIRNDANVSFFCDPASGAVTLRERTHAAAILDTGTGEMRLLINGARVATTAITGAFATALSTFGIGKLPDGASSFFPGDLDEIAIFSAALSDEDVQSAMSRRLTSAEVDLVYLFHCDEGTGLTLFNSVPAAPNVTLSNTTWVGSLEGGTELAGQSPPVWEGLRRQVEPVIVDSQNYVYEVSRGPTAVTVSDVQDKGSAAYVMDSAVADPYLWSPVAGHCVTAYMNGRTLLRLQSAPQGTLTVTVTGDTLDTAGIVKKLAKSYAGWTDSQIDLGAFFLVSANYPQTVGIGYRLENPDIWDVMQELAHRAGGWVTMTRSGLLTIQILSEPSNPKFHLNENDVQTDAVQRISLSLAVKQVKLSYRPYAKTQGRTEVATSLTEAEKIDIGQEKRYTSSPVNSALVAVRANAEILEQDTLYDSEEVALTEAMRRHALWGVNRATYLLPLTRGLFQYAIGDVITATIKAPDGTYVENLDGTVLIVVAYVEDPKLETIQIEAWGAEPPTFTYLMGSLGEFLLAADGSYVIAG